MKGYMAHLNSKKKKKKKVFPDVEIIKAWFFYWREALFQEEDYRISIFK